MGNPSRSASLSRLAYPGSGWAVALGSENAWQVECFGTTGPSGAAITEFTLFDVASLTKVVATLPACLVLMKAGELDLDRPLREYISSIGWFQEPSLGSVTARQLLTHISGLPAWKPLFAQSSNRSVLAAAVLQSTVGPPGKREYSDLGLILLGHLIELLSGKPLDQFVDQQVLQPLGMHHTGFNPQERWPGVECVATERCGWRKMLLQGVVHDENAFALEGVSGHAGLFSSVRDLARYLEAWLNELAPLELEAQAREIFQTVSTPGGAPEYGLGWRVAPGLDFSGPGNRPGAFGHTGYTGTSLWFHPEAQQALVLLNNRVYPTRVGTDSAIHALRQQVHEHFLRDRIR